MVRNVFILWMILVVLLAGTGSHAQNIRFQQNIRGGFAITGNSLLNNSINSFLNTAGGNTKSSSADLVLPLNSTIEKAYLYVEGYTGTKMTSVRFRVPGGTYVTYNTTSPGFLGNPGSSYQQFMVDVTNAVSPTGYISTVVPGGDPSGNGRYAVADPTPTGSNNGYGWALLVVYTNPASKFRSVTIADNNALFGLLSPAVTVNINNVSVPSSGVVNAVVGITGSYGDVGLADGASFGPVPGTPTDLSDPFTGATNDILNSSIAFAANNNVSADGGPAISGSFTGRTPALFTNPNDPSNTNWSSYFYDADILNASGILPNSTTPINIRMTQTSGGLDALGSGSYAIAVDIAAAVLTKSVSPAAIAPGGTATYTFTITNTQPGSINLTNISFTDNLPSGLRIANPAGAVLSGGSGGTITAPAGGTSVSLSGLSLASGQTATITVNITNVPGQTNPSCASNPAAFTNGFANITSVSPNLANGVTDQCLVVTQATPPPDTDTVIYCQGAVATPLTATGSNLLWYTAATGGTGTATAPTPSTATPGTTTWYVSQTVGGLESPRSPVVVIVHPTPSAPVVSSPVVYCQGTTAAPLTATGSNLLWYTTATGGTGTVTAPTPSTATPGTTTWHVSQTANGCESPRSPVSVTVNPTMAVSTTAQICPGGSYPFGSQTITAAGTYTETFAAANGCDSVVTLTMTVGNTIQVNLSRTICQGESTTFNGTVYTAAGSYSYTTTSSGGCDSVTTLNLTVNSQTTPTFTAIAPICAGSTAPVLPATSNNGIAGTWNPGAVSNTATGTYTFTPNAGQCATTTTLTVTVNPNVTPTFTAITPICSGTTAPVLPATSNNGITGTWNPGAVSNTATGTYTFTPNTGQCATATTLTIIVKPTSTATQTIAACTTQLPYPWNGQSLTASGTYTHTQPNVNGCDSITTLTFTVNPTINTTQAITVCETQLPYPWNGQNLTASGTYTHTQPNAAGCDSTMTLTFTVNSQTTPTFTAAGPICSGSTAPVLPATSNNGIAGTWNPGAVSNTATGTYTFTPNAGQCATTATLTVTVNPLPAAPAVTTPVSYCQDAPATPLSATGTNLQWYTTATGGTGTALAPTPSTAAAGTTTWYVSQSANGCEGPRAAITVTIRPTPAAPSVTTPVTYCQGEAATPLSATGTSLQWYTTATGGTGTATAPTPPTTAPGTTTWYVSQAVDGCESPRAALSVIVHPLPAAPEVSSPVNYCQGDAITPLTAEGNDLRWYTEATGGMGSSAAPVPTGDAPGTQSWYVSQTENGCEGPRTKIEVIIHPAPTLDAKLDIVGTTMYLAAQATGAGLTYAWTPPDGLSCTDCDRPRADPERNTVYTVTVTTSAGCSASDTVGIYLDCNKIFIPNTFSPNGDGNNDRFYPMGLSLKQLKVFRVYNRWGELLFSRENVPANDPLYGWDGNYQSKTVKPDVFVYYLEAICTTGEVISRKGDVTIVR